MTTRGHSAHLKEEERLEIVENSFKPRKQPASPGVLLHRKICSTALGTPTMSTKL